MLMGRCIMSYVSWAPHGTVAVPGVMPRLTMREKMAPLYRRNAAAAAARKGTAKNNSVISVFIPVFLCSSSESTAFAAARRGPKAGDSPVQKAAQAVDKHADNGWKTTPQVCGPSCA
jgi:hypothetical protein